MIRKYASLAVLDAWQVPVRPGLRRQAHRVDFDYAPRPGYLYVRSRAISSRANDNHDEFPAEEIEKSYRTFLGKPVFVNHHNANHRRARGVIVAVALHRDRNPDGTPDTWAEVLQEIDARRFPKLAQAILAGRVDRTSMGVDVEESQCTACGNKATDPAQYCRHLPALKGRKIRKRGSDGRLREEIIREICRGLSFFENSLLVEEPADPTAYVLGTPDDRGMKMAASLRREAITGEHAEPGHDIWAEPQGGESPVAAEVWHNQVSREPGESGENWYRGISYHGPYHMIRHPQTRSTYVVDAQGRNTNGRDSGYGNHETNGSWGEHQAEQHWHGLESAGPDADRIGTREEPRFAIMKERTPAFPHSRIDPEDESRAQRPDARVHEPQGHGPEDEWHGPYEVVKHPQTGKFHVVDNAGRHAPGSAHLWNGSDTQMQAERSRDYIDKRQQSKERAHGLVDKIWGGTADILDPGGTEESRQSDENLRTGEELMTRYAGGRGHIKFESEEDGGSPYYHREHYLPNGNESGWYAKHYGGAHTDIYHHATGDESHEQLELPQHPEDYNRSMTPRLHPDFDDISMGKALHEWHQNFGEGDPEDGTRGYLESAPPYGNARIHRWKRRYPDGRSPRPQQHEAAVPDWVRSQWRGGGKCERCGEQPAATEYSGTGEKLCWSCLEARRAAARHPNEHEAVRYEHPSDHPFFQANPVSHRNITAAYHDSTEDEKNQGHRWYADAHHVATAVAGGDSARGAGLVAAYSPRTLWPANLFNASRAHRENRAFGGPGEGAMGVHRMLAAPIIAGQHHSEAFSNSAPKVGAFAHLIEHGGDTEADRAAGTERVVVDRHALSTAIGRRVTKADLQQVPIDKKPYYDHVAGAFRQAARDISADLGHYVAPHQVQATVWLRQIRKNTAEDTASGAQLDRGRVTRDRNAWTQWNQHAREQHPTIPQGNMHMTGKQQRLAYGETRVPPQIDTLRAEECPVCGEDQVWTGQRCPVCGYVSPPDLFRDPDTSKAMEVREQLDSGAVDIPPEGQGSWPDADAQLYHPDQIAPDGVPGPAAQVLDAGDGQLPQDGDEPADGALACPECGTQFGPEEGLAEGDPCPECGQGQLVPAEALQDAEDGQELPPGGEMAEEEQELPPGEEPAEDEEEPPQEDDEDEDEQPPPDRKKRK